MSTVVIFGTISMFLYPFLYRNGLCALTPDQMGIYTGATLHEVAHVVGAGDAMGNGISDSAIIVKMIRVMMLVPVLLDYYLSGGESAEKTSAERTEVSEDCGALVCNRLYGCHRFQFF